MNGDVVGREAVGAAAADRGGAGAVSAGGAADGAGTGGRTPGPAVCGTCGAQLVEGARFCEACGAAAPGDGTDGGAAADGEATADGDAAVQVTGGGDEAGDDAGKEDGAAEAATGQPATEETQAPDDGAAPACERCGGTVGADGYCTTCGHRAVEPVTVVDGGTLAYATHRGRRHRRNEDSGALAVTEDRWPVVVVSDGVSISPNPHLASRAAVDTIAKRLGGSPFGGADDLVEATVDADAAVGRVPADTDPSWTPDGTHPACTLVAAVVAGRTAHVLNVGDARGYVVRPTDDGWVATQVSRDHSVAAQAAEQGIDLEIALSLPGGHAITAWLGADADELDVHVVEVEVAPRDLVLLCSDGLWNYVATDDALSDLLSAVLPPPGDDVQLAVVCEQLVGWALDHGGHDNITVALAPAADPGSGEAPATDDVPEEDM